MFFVLILYFSNFEPTWFYAIGQMSIIENGQILNKQIILQSGHTAQPT